MPPWNAKSSAALTVERDLFADVRSLLIGQGCVDPEVVRADRVSDCEVVALITVPMLGGKRRALTATIQDTGEIVLVDGFQA